MPSIGWRTLGSGSILGHVRADCKGARASVQLVGPWIDDYFAEALLAALPGAPALQVITRPIPEGESCFTAACDLLRARPQTEVRVHERVHAKVLLIDEAIVYCGSANWYRYSLEEGREIVLRGPLAQAPGVAEAVALLWDEARPLTAPPRRKRAPGAKAEGQRTEILDPIAAQVLRDVPGAFVIGKKAGRRR